MHSTTRERRPMDARALTSLSLEDLYGMSATVDWRSEEDLVVGEFAERLADPDSLTCNVPESEDEPFVVTYRGTPCIIPLTWSGSDRYVTIGSLVEILKGDYRVYLISGCEADDTHSFILIDESTADDIERNHRAWLDAHLLAVEAGYDYFSGLRVPYYGNENHNPDFAEQRAAQSAAMRDAMNEVESMLDTAFRKKPWWKFW